VTELEGLVAAGEIRYVFLTDPLRATSTSSSRLASGSSADTAGVLQAVLVWVSAHGVVVPPADYGGGDGTLYRFAPEEDTS